MAYEASDKKKFTNKPPMMQHERSLSRMAGKSEAGGVMADPLKQPGQDSMGAEDGAAVAAEHGPAHEVHMMHDHEGGRHHVMSMHPDGHQHESEHGSVEEAHEHGKKLAGAGEPDGDEMGEPEFE